MTAPAPVEVLTAADHEAIVAVLAAAFHQYPAMRFILGPSEDYDRDLRRLVGFYADKRLLRGWPALGIRLAGELVAATLVNEPESESSPAVDAALATLRAEIGEAAYARMMAFEGASDRNEPATRHYFVGMIGVRPEVKGQGHAGRLLTRVHEMAAERGYDGVCLTTENPGNLSFYRHLGYRILAETQVDTLTTWTLFRDGG
ncbi:MAG: GNAT family N-acetyltransferase [Gemmatimonadales bacterium]